MLLAFHSIDPPEIDYAVCRGHESADGGKADVNQPTIPAESVESDRKRAVGWRNPLAMKSGREALLGRR